MRPKLLFGFLLVAMAAFCVADPIYGQTVALSGSYACYQSMSARLGDCNRLHGPVHTVELWSSYRNPDSQSAATYRTILTYSRDGLLIGREVRRNGAVETREQYQKTAAGSTRVEDNDDVLEGETHHSETVTYLNPRGELISSESKENGVLTSTEKSEFDDAGRKVSELDCWGGGKTCSRTESQYDSQGNLTLVRQVELPSGRVTSRTEYEYPEGNRKRTLDFDSLCGDPNAPASLPTYIIETTYDGAGRVLEATTTSPAQTWAQENTHPGGVMNLPSPHCPQPGHVVSRYDDHGRLLQQTSETHGLDRETLASTSFRYAYDASGNEISLLTTTTRPNCGNAILFPCPDETRSELSYKYDRFGNWTSRASYTLDERGRRGKPSSVDYQKLTYY